MTVKKLALVAALLGASVGAHASLEIPNNANDHINGELILTVWNTVNNRALTVDLGVRASEYMNNRAESSTFSLNPTDVAWLGTGGVRWNVVGGSSNEDNFPESYGFYFTAKPGDVAMGGAGLAEFGAVFGAFATYANKVPGMGAAGDSAVNLTYRSEGSQYAGSGAVWGENAGNVSTFFGPFASTAADKVLNAWTADYVGSEDFTAAFANLNQGTTWSLNLAGNSLNYTAPGIETPAPAAAWLLGSALMGMAGVVRRRRKTA